jgi:hypothetical protein
MGPPRCAADPATRFSIEDFTRAPVASGRSCGRSASGNLVRPEACLADGAAREREAGTGSGSNHWNNDAPSKQLSGVRVTVNEGAAHASADLCDSHSRISLR